jgi:hypothetical protein
MLESQFRLIIDQAPGHHQVAGNPFRAISFERLDLVLGGAVQLLARDIVVDLGRPLTVRAVGAAQVTRVGNPHRTVLGTVAAKLAWAGVAAVEAAGCPVLAVAERLTVVPVDKAAALTVALTPRTITIRLLLPVTERLTVTIAKGLTLTTSERLTVSSAEAAAVAVALTARTITIRLIFTVTVRFAVAEGLTLTGTKTATFAITFTARTITKGLVLPVTIRLTLTGAVRLTLTGARGSTGGFTAFPVFPGPESAGISA